MKRIEAESLGNSPATWLFVLSFAVGWGVDALAQAPAITSQPQSVSVAAGMPATFNVQASGSGTLRYLWQFKGSPVPGATNPAYTLTNAQPVNVGEYSVVVTNSSGSVTSAPAVLVLGPIRGWGNTNSGQLRFPPSATNVAAIAAGEAFAMALKPDGAVIAWGSNSSGQTNVPPSATNVVAISTKQNHCLALRADGTVVAWGSNLSGKTNVPTSLTNAAVIAAGGNHNVVLRSNGTVVVWGSSTSGQTNQPFGLAGVVGVAAGANHSLALRGNGTVAAWGNTNAGQTIVPAGLSDVVAIAAGDDHNLALRADGTVVAWGANGSGQRNVPASLTNAVAIAAGRRHSLALTAEGRVVVWGENFSGQATVPPAAANGLALAGGAEFSLVLEGIGAPAFASPFGDRQARQDDMVTLGAMAVGSPPLSYQWYFNGAAIDGGTNASLALGQVQPTDAGAYSVEVSNALGSVTSRVMTLTVHQRLSMAAWGLNGNGQCSPPAGLTGVLAIDAGGSHALALLENGTVVAWGDNTYGQTNVPASATNIIAISAGTYHSLALRADGGFLQWGGTRTFNPPPFGGASAIAAGDEYSLGVVNGSVTYWQTIQARPDTPGPRFGLSGVTAVAAGDTHAVALRNDGTVVAWTRYNFGQTNVPPGLSNVVDIAAGYAHTLALRDDGTVVAWGFNNAGQTNVPVDLTNALAVAASGDRSMALRSDGTVAAWGRNFKGESTVPTGLTNVAQISAGSSFSLALVGDSAPCITLPPRGRTVFPGTSVTLDCTVAGTPPLSFQWQRNGNDIPGATNSSLTIAGFTIANEGEYRVIATNRHGSATSKVAALTVGPIITWGRNSSEQIWIPAGVTNPIQVAGGDSYSVALDAEGAPIQWGGLFGLDLPANLGRCTAISAGFRLNLALLEDSSVAAWGETFSGATNVPSGLTNVVAVSAGNGYALALTAEGRVATWGDPFLVQSNVVAGLSEVVAISAGGLHSLALNADGTVFAWGRNAGAATNVPADLVDVVAIAAGFGHSVVLKADGTVTVWGTSSASITNPPSGLSDVVAIGAGFSGCLALRSDGSLVAWGQNQYGETNLPAGVNNVIRIASGSFHHIAIAGDGKPAITGRVPRRSVRAGGTLRLMALAAGAPPLRYQWQFKGADITGATNTTLAVSSMTAAEAGAYRCIVSNDFGSITSPITTVTVIGESLRFDTSVDGLHSTNGVIHLRLANLSGVGPVTIYASTNLADWEGIHTNPPVAGTLDFTDSTATNHAARYYRAVEGPQP